MEVKIRAFLILVDNCHIRLPSGLKNSYPRIFLQILQFSCPRILSVGSKLQMGEVVAMAQVVALGMEMIKKGQGWGMIPLEGKLGEGQRDY